MEPNNFINRKKLNLNLINRNPYKAISSKKSLVHPLLFNPINQKTSYINEINYNTLGFYIPLSNFGSKAKHTLYEKNIIIYSEDRDINTYLNPLKFTIKLNPLPSDPTPIISSKTLTHIKYIQILNVMLPLHYNLYREIITYDNNFVTYIANNIKTLAINSEITYNLNTIQICNKIIEGNDWELNYTTNRINVPSYSLLYKNGQYTLYKYNHYKNLLEKNKIIYLRLKELDDYNILTTNNESTNHFCAALYPKKIINNFINFDLKNSVILFKNSNLYNLTKIEMSFIDNQGNELYIPLLDNKVSELYKNCNCTLPHSNYACSCYYLRHPYNALWQVHVIMKVGTIETHI